jgi:hypothetical protein
VVELLEAVVLELAAGLRLVDTGVLVRARGAGLRWLMTVVTPSSRSTMRIVAWVMSPLNTS